MQEYFLNLVDTTGELPDIMLESFPEATSGVYAVMLKLNAKQQLTLYLSLVIAQIQLQIL